MDNFWGGKRVLVTGGTGFIGSHLVEMLSSKGAYVTIASSRCDRKFLENVKSYNTTLVKADLTELGQCKKAVKSQDIVMNVAASVGGIEHNINHPGTIYTKNVLMNTNMLEAAKNENVERYLVVSSACVYKRHCTIPTPETEGYDDWPEPTNDGYGWSKRMAEIQGQLYAREFGMKIAIARPYNAYGPRDNFEPKTSHVIPALIKRVIDGENPLNVWGSGNQSRSFLYATDFCRGLMEITEKYAVADPLNIGADEETTIRELVEIIIKHSGKDTKAVFDTSKPEGQPRRKCDTRKAFEKIGFKAEVSLETGIRETIEWYKKNLM